MCCQHCCQSLKKEILLQHDNAQAQSAYLTTEFRFIGKKTSHPPYNPDLAPCTLIQNIQELFAAIYYVVSPVDQIHDLVF